MSEENRPEKLTPDSSSGYDGSSPHMSDENGKDIPQEEPKPKKEESSDGKELSEKEAEALAKAKKKEREEKESKSALVEIFGTIFGKAHPQNSSEDKKLFDSTLKFAIGEKSKAEGGDAEHNLALILWSYTEGEQTTPANDDTIARQEEKEKAEVSKNIFNAIKEYAESSDSGLDSDLVFEEMAKIAEEESAPAAQDEDLRIFRFEEMLSKTLEDATHAKDDTLKKLAEEWELLNAETETGNALKAKVIEAKMLLEKLAHVDENKPIKVSGDVQIEAKEETTDAEVLAAQKEFDQEFAKVIVRMFSAPEEHPITPLDEKVKAKEESHGEEIDFAMTMTDLFVRPGATKKERELTTAALLESYSTEGADEELKAADIRNKILEYAHADGLDTRRITLERFNIAENHMDEVEDEQVNPLESVAVLNAFEQRVEDNIINATPSQVEDIQNTWKALLENPNIDDVIRGQANEAIEVLQNIINLKLMQEERKNDEKVVNRHLEPPEKLKKKEKEDEQSSPENEDVPKDKATERLAKDVSDLLQFISADRQLTTQEVAMIDSLLHVLASSNRHTKHDRDGFLAEKKIAELLFLYAGRGDAEMTTKLRRQVFNYADEKNLKADEIRNELTTLEDKDKEKGTTEHQQDMQEQITQLFEDNLRIAKVADISRLGEHLEEVKEKADEDSPLYAKAQDALEHSAKVIEAKEAIGNEVDDSEDIKEIKDPELALLNNKIERLGDKDTEEYLQRLIVRLDEGSLSTSEMQEALEELNSRSRAVTNKVKDTLDNKDSTPYMTNKAALALAFEANINEYRKYLIRVINKDTAEAIPQSQLHSQTDKRNELLSQLEEVHTVKETSELSVSRFEQYMKQLKKALVAQDVLTKDQLDAAYYALTTHGTILRDDLMRDNKLVEAVDLFQKVQEVQGDVYAHLTRVYKDDIKVVESKNRDVVQATSAAHAAAVGDTYFGIATDLGPTTVEAKSGNRYFETGHRSQIGGSIADIRNFAEPPDSSLPEKIQERYRDVVDRSKDQEIYSKEEQIDNMVNELANLRRAAFEAGASPDSTNAMIDLTNKLQSQRQELHDMKQLYKGRMEERENPEDAILYEGYVHTALGERIRRLREELQPGGQRAGKYDEKQIFDYYTELKKWAKIILKNDVRNNPDKAGKKDVLRLSNDRYRQYKAIVDNPNIKDVSAIQDAANRDFILHSVNYMRSRDQERGGDYLRYFMKNTYNPKGHEKFDNVDFNPDKLLGVDYRHAEGTSSFGLPKSLEDSMAIVANQYSTEKSNYKTGGNRELIDGEGNFKYNNFYYWIREQINADINYNKDGQINPMSKINLKGDASSVSLAELLILVPEYLSQRNFEIKQHEEVNTTTQQQQAESFAGWGRQTEHPGFTWEQANQLGAEVEFRILMHEVRIQYIQASVGGDKQKYLQLMDALHKNNHWARANNILALLGLPSSVVNGTQEIDDVYGKPEKQGSLGKAISDMLVGYNYINEISDFHEIKDHGEKRQKYFNENMFYKFWEANGTNTFLINMAEGSLNNNNEAKRAYGRFIIKRLDVAKNEALARIHGTDQVSIEKRERIEQKIRDQIKDINTKSAPDVRNVDLSVSFTENEHLKAFHTFAERDVIGNNISDEALNARIKVGLLQNLRKEYFTDLVEMRVGKIDKIPDGKSRGKDRPDTYMFLRTNGTVRFGDIKLGDETMEDLLMSFDPSQITAFDYENGKDADRRLNRAADPLVEAQRRKGSPLTEAEMRAELDKFMHKDSQNHKLFRKNEKMMLAFTKHITNFERKWINHFRDIPENEISRQMVMKAFKKCVEKAHGIDDMESEYAWTQARDYAYIWGIGAWNDVTGIGFRVDGKLMQTGKWRAHRGGKDGGGNAHTFDEIHASSLPFLHALQIHDLEGNSPNGHQSIFSLMQGGHGGYITPRAIREFKARSTYTIAHDAEELYVTNNLTSAAELVDLLSTTEYDFSNIIKTDVHGNVVFEYDKARKLFRDWRKAIRYSFQKNGLDYRDVIWANGKETSLYNHFFGKKTRALNELIKRETGRSIDEMYRDPADCVMATIIGAEIYEHRRMHADAHHWSIQNVLELERLIRKFMQEYDLEDDPHGDPKLQYKDMAFTHKVFSAALKAYHTSYHKMYTTEFGSSLAEGVLKGIGEGIEEIFKGKWVY